MNETRQAAAEWTRWCLEDKTPTKQSAIQIFSRWQRKVAPQLHPSTLLCVRFSVKEGIQNIVISMIGAEAHSDPLANQIQAEWCKTQRRITSKRRCNYRTVSVAPLEGSTQVVVGDVLCFVRERVPQ